jgi:hypothetical protein
VALSVLGFVACNSNDVTPAATAAKRPSEMLVSPGIGDSVATPAGWRPKACVTEIPNGAHVSNAGLVRRLDGTTFQIAKCISNTASAPVDSGWMEFASYQTGTGSFRSITAGWRVPAAPAGTYSGRNLYYSFPGMENATYIIQPVIQYGYNGDYGGSFWTAASWHCDLGPNCKHGTPIAIYPGDSVVGTATGTSCINNVCTWTMSTVDVTHSTRSDYTIDDNDSYSWATGGAVEVYGLTSCSQYPVSGIWYSGLAIRDRNSLLQSPIWAAHYYPSPSPSCQFNVVSTAATVRLYHDYTALSDWITGDTATSIYTAHASGGVTPYSSSYHWEWCAIDCGSDAPLAPVGGGSPFTVEHGWHDVGYSTQSICWTMSGSLLRVTVTDFLMSQAVALYTVPVLEHVCS